MGWRVDLGWQLCGLQGRDGGILRLPHRSRNHRRRRDGRWRFGSIGANSCIEITLKVKVPETQDFEFDMLQGVNGEGFVNVANDYSTTYQDYLIKNCAYATSEWNAKPISDCVTVKVGKELGTELSTREYGSGLFDVEEKVSLITENKSIEWEEDFSASYKPTSIMLYNNRTLSYDNK
jgi:hypothetical protein